MIASFGSGVGKADAMFFNRMGYGKVVNRFYDLQYNKPQAQDAERMVQDTGGAQVIEYILRNGIASPFGVHIRR